MTERRPDSCKTPSPAGGRIIGGGDLRRSGRLRVDGRWRRLVGRRYGGRWWRRYRPRHAWNHGPWNSHHWWRRGRGRRQRRYVIPNRRRRQPGQESTRPRHPKVVRVIGGFEIIVRPVRATRVAPARIVVTALPALPNPKHRISILTGRDSGVLKE